MKPVFFCSSFTAQRYQQYRETFLAWRWLSLFFILPLTVIIMRVTVWEVPPPLTDLLALDVLLLFLFLLARFSLLMAECRLGNFKRSRPDKIPSVQLSTVVCSELDSLLSRNGYRFDAEAGQGNCRFRLGAVSAAIAMLGLLMLLTAGLHGYLFQFSGVVYVGIGDPFPLNDSDAYGIFSKGPLAAYDDIHFQIKGYDRILPSQRYPSGGKDIALLDLQGTQLWRGILEPGVKHREGNYDFAMESHVYDIMLSISTIKDHHIYGDFVRARPLLKPLNKYNHYGKFTGGEQNHMSGEIWFDQVTDRMLVRARHKDSVMEATLGMGPEHRMESNGYVLKNNGIGRWTQINVMRVRYVGVMKIGAVLLLVGILLRLFFPVRWLWVERNDDGSVLLFSRYRKILRSLES